MATRKLDPEVRAMQKIVRALRPFDSETQTRIMRYLVARYTSKM